jgi:hypothetical protein
VTETPAIETPSTEVPVEEPEEAQEPQGPAEVNCRWCGKPHELAANESEDWLCQDCERFQDTTTCPTCHQLARVSLLPADMTPEPHAPTRRRKAKE